MRATATATARLSMSLLGAAALHGAVFGVAAAVLSHRGAERAAPAALDVDVVEVTAPKPDPVADSAPGAALTPANPVAPAPRRVRAPARVVALVSNPASDLAAVDSTAAPDDAPGPSVAALPAAPGPAVAARAAPGPSIAAPSAGTTTSAEPRYRSNPKPEYPLPSLRRHEEGVVLLDVVVGPDGSPAAITLNRSSGHPLLDRAALDGVRVWTFEPARVAGVPVSKMKVVPIRFSLSEP
jgi:periplasmic protein TonB